MCNFYILRRASWYTNRSHSASQKLTRPHAAAACSGLQFSVSSALTSAPESNSRRNISSALLIQHCTTSHKHCLMLVSATSSTSNMTHYKSFPRRYILQQATVSENRSRVASHPDISLSLVNLTIFTSPCYK